MLICYARCLFLLPFLLEAKTFFLVELLLCSFCFFRRFPSVASQLFVFKAELECDSLQQKKSLYN